ncbi:MAG: DNA polymerase III subunit beta [Melioribacteraceae bacterium]|nr:MAG: DNA polymerase III subunit beta [Melioribacteraceae bacterium]
MEFKVNSVELEKLLIKIIPAVPTRTPMPVLENFLFDIKGGLLTIFATDLEISLKSSLPVTTSDELSVVVPAKLLFDIVRSLKETDILFKVDSVGNKMQLITDNGEYTITYLEADEYPDIPVFPGEENKDDVVELELAGSGLKYAFEHTSFAMSKEEMRPAMMGTLLEFVDEGLRFVATDGHRLVNMLMKGVGEGVDNQYIVPEKAVTVLGKLVDDNSVKVYLSKTHVSFILKDIELITRLIGQKYPDYKSVIPLENEFHMKVKTKELQDAIKRMMLFSTSTTRRVKFSVADNKLEISAEDHDMGTAGKENLFCEYDGEPLEIGFNSAYVNDILSHNPGEKELTFNLHSPTKAVIIKPVEEKENIDLMMLLMPVRLNN